jgi:hypothetical protein
MSRRVVRIVLVAAAVVVAGVVAVLVTTGLRIRRDAHERIENFRKETLATGDLFCELQTKLSADPFFHEPRKQGDAAPLLSQFVEWQGQTSKPTETPLRFPDGFDTVAFEKTWLAPRAELTSLDFGWMQALHRFDPKSRQRLA